ncbi:MAG: MotA/TolQ/ExbB proton channel family protein [Gammaproteobacteria bacterium]|nr:MotA/TolQ/ExbB proton channel family protein [Gammaproteobacteria bacterium]MCY4339833.1 MotA/TolQ/ExbB proton channel family protein [Gammaproteobacteria bacterium]
MFLSEAWVSIRSFFELGGPVLYGILAVTMLMWTLIVERLWYFFGVLPGEMRKACGLWESGRRDGSWFATNLRRLILSEVGLSARRNLGLIQTLMQILPLLGLLGTVWGMVQVFEIMTVFGTGNARLMAGGVSQATIPTMSGLVAALSGLYLSAWLKQRAKVKMDELEDALEMRFDEEASVAE